VEVFAYIQATDWAHFLEIQEQLLLSVNDIVRSAGTRLALPSQTMYRAEMPEPFRGEEPAAAASSGVVRASPPR
jgi:hypothetical protein